MTDSQETPRVDEKNFDFLDQEWLTERRFTDHARLMLDHASRRALDRGICGVFPPLLILWAMLRWERKVGVVVLERCGVNLGALEGDVAAQLLAFENHDWREGIDGICLSQVAELACEEAGLLGHNYVGSEHLVLGLCRMEDEVTKRVFEKHGIFLGHCKRALLALLAEG